MVVVIAVGEAAGEKLCSLVEGCSRCQPAITQEGAEGINILPSLSYLSIGVTLLEISGQGLLFIIHRVTSG